MDNELAIIAIKGGRFTEAENLFNQDLKTTPSINSYFGLGICKLNMLLDVNRSIEEVVYCFEKALSLADDDKKSEFKTSADDYLKIVLTQYSSIYKQLEEQKKKETQAAALGAVLTIGSAMVGSSRNSNGFTQVASLVTAGAGVGVVVDGLTKLGQIPKMQSFIIETGEKLISQFVKLGISDQNALHQIFDSSELLKITQDINDKNKVNANRALSIALACFGFNRFYLGKWKSGILFILSGGGFGIWYIIDLYKVIKNDFHPKW